MLHTLRIGLAIKRTVLISFTVMLTLLYPSAASFAETAPNDTTDGQSQTAADRPPGEDATTYHYNAETGKWENDHYIWDPATRTTTPKDTPPYSYNPSTGKWDTTEWRYNGATGKWEPNIISITQPPAGEQAAGATAPVPPAPTDNSASASDTPAPSAPETAANGNAYFNGFYNAAISNTVVSTAHSGNASVNGNNKGGSASTGNANAISNVFNMLQSTSAFSDLANVNTFVTDIDGDVTGDLFIDPSLLGNLQPAHATGDMSPDIKVTIAQDNSITNDIHVDAASGDATVYGNNDAGDATTGNANAVANLVNLINSSIAANQSFIGTLNINGNVNGDILLPPDMLQTLIASNAPTTTVSLSPEDSAALRASLSDSQAVTNTVQANAVTGNAVVTGNNTAGNATTGNGTTNITVLNLTGRQVAGNDSLLVFVNVLGKWVGALMDAPQGATTAALGGGITKNTYADKTDIDASVNNTITNNVAITAQTGNATVEHNRTAGDAQTGNATASANILNVSNSHLSLNGWFGMLLINVFGSWFGSFGVNTEAGTKTSQNTINSDVSSTTDPSTQQVRVFRLTTTITNSSGTAGAIAAEVGPPASAQPIAKPRVLGTNTILGTGNNDTAKGLHKNFGFSLGALSLGGGLFAAERAFARQRHGRH
jgi:hypothetical protein